MTLNKYILYSFLITAASSAQDIQQDSVIIENFVEADVAKEVDTVELPPAEHVYTDRSFTPGFGDKYKGDPEFTYETKVRAKTLWDRFWEAIGNFFDRLFSSGDKATTTSAFEIIMRILAFLIIGFVVYMIVRVILKKEGMWIFGRSGKKITGSDVITENIHELDFSQLTEETKRDGNYRLAVRYYYLWVLKKLSAREIIDWHWDKTNSDYLYEIKDTTLRKDFEYLSYLYDYSWYGEFPIDSDAFTKAEKAFRKTLNTL